MGAPADARILVPVAESPTLRQTVGFAVQAAVSATEDDGRAVLHFVHAARRTGVDVGDAETAEASGVLDRVMAWTTEDLPEEEADRVDVDTALVGTGEYLFSPRDYAEVFASYAERHDLHRIVVDPAYRPGGSAPMLASFEAELERMGFAVEEAPDERPTRRAAIVTRGGLRQYVIIFTTSFLFYQLVGGFAGLTDYVTGTFSAAVVTLVLGRISLKTEPSLDRMLFRVVRFVVYVPYLLWEIFLANFTVAYYILHPRLPIDPEMVRYEAAVWTDISVTTLANSITLTPGTLTVDIADRDFLVHTLTDSAKDGLNGGGLERAVRFVFYGRSGVRLPSPRERSAIEGNVTLDDEADDSGGPDEGGDADDTQTDAASDRGESS